MVNSKFNFPPKSRKTQFRTVVLLDKGLLEDKLYKLKLPTMYTFIWHNSGTKSMQ